MFKRLLTLLFVLLLLAGGALWYLRTNLDHIVKRALETYGSAATGTDVEVSGVHIALSTGKGTVSGLKIGNPKSYIAATALKVGDIRMQIDKNSIIGSGPVIFSRPLMTASSEPSTCSARPSVATVRFFTRPASSR